MKIKLHLKLTFIFCSTIVIGLLIGYFFLSYHLKNYLENNIQTNLTWQSMLIKDFLETHWSRESNLQDADILADRFGKELTVRVTIIDVNGKVIGDSYLNKDELEKIENHITRPEIKDAANKGFGISRRFSNTIKMDLLYIAVPFGKDKPLGYLRLAIPLQEIDVLETKLKKMAGVALVIVFLLSLGFTFFISIIVSKPLTEMAEIAKAMAGGDFSKKPSIRSKDEVGDLAKALTFMSNEIKDNTQKIKQEGAKLNTVLSRVFEGVIVTNEKGEILLINPSIRKQFSIDKDTVGKKPIEVIRNSSVQNIIDKILKEKQFITEEIIINKPEEKILKVNGVPILRNDELEGSVLVFHDITELRRLEKIRQDFVANVSHELRTPISSIKGYAETLLDGAINDKDNLRDFISIIYQDSNRLAKLIDDLLDLSKIESGKMDIELLPVNIKDIINSSVTSVSSQAKIKSISIDLDIPSNLPLILADKTRLLQVLINLLDNAVKYTPEKGSIKISSHKEDKFLQTDVSDTGIGIPEKDIPRIFERFYRVDKAHSRDLGGTGLGLSIVKHIVQAHGGSVWVKSDLDRGSTFSFTIPIV